MRVIVTGAAGRIGSEIVRELSDAHDLFLIDRASMSGQGSGLSHTAPAALLADLSIPGSEANPWPQTFAGATTVLHLAADVRNLAPWDRVIEDNIKATWNVIEAAVKHKVRRVVFASSNWAVKGLEHAMAPSCYQPDGPKIGSEAATRPIHPYGLSKALGELAGGMFIDEGALDSFLAVRIGYYHPDPPTDENLRRLWIGSSDLRSLFRRCVEAEFEGFHVVYATSAQPIAPYDLAYTRKLLSWKPQQSL